MAALGSGAPRFAAPSFAATSLTFLALMLGFQIYNYGFHRLLHTRPWVRFHRWHHVSRITTPLSAQSLSWFETLMPNVPRVRSFACWANPSIFHALHRARWNGHFGFQSVAMDRLFGSEFPDWPALRAQTSARCPLRSTHVGG